MRRGERDGGFPELSRVNTLRMRVGTSIQLFGSMHRGGTNRAVPLFSSLLELL
jgi:hypothetical protein